MGWSIAYLICTLVGGLFVANALRPLGRDGGEVAAGISFFAAWPTAELPLWHVAWQAAATVLFAALGAFGHWEGWAGLAVMALSWTGLGILAAQGDGAGAVLDAATLQDPWPGGVVDEDLPRTGRDTMWRFPRLLWPMPRPATGVRVTRNLDYAGDGAPRHRLDVYVAKGGAPSPAPVLVYIHGGAWVIGDKREQGLPMLVELARRGWVGVSINYGLSPRATWPEHVVDCKRALAWVRRHIAEFGGDPRFVAVSGGSAGGHLAALVALTPGDPVWQPGFEGDDTHVDACIPFYGVYDFTASAGDTRYSESLGRMLARQVFKASIADEPDAYRQASPLSRVGAAAPPFFVIHGANDTLVPVAEARRFVEALRRTSRAPVLYAELPGAQHAFDVLPSVRGAHTVAAVVRFLETLRRRPPSRDPAAPARGLAGSA